MDKVKIFDDFFDEDFEEEEIISFLKTKKQLVLIS